MMSAKENRMDTVLQQLEAWGCDVHGALERLADDEELYLTCLRIFTTDEGFGQLRTGLDNKDITASFEAAHTLKGVSANLGLTPISSAVSALTEELRAKRTDKLEPLWQNVDTALQTFRSLIPAEA